MLNSIDEPGRRKVWISCRLILLILVLGACNLFKQNEPVILYYSDETDTRIEQLLADTTVTTSWEFVKTENPEYLQEDSLRAFRVIVVPLSDLIELDYRAGVTLTRFMEAGGHVIAIEDTVPSAVPLPWIGEIDGQDTRGSDANMTRSNNVNLVHVSEGSIESEFPTTLAHVIENGSELDYSAVTTPMIPEDNRFTREVLIQGMEEPMQMAILPDGDVLIVERKGGVKLYDDSQNQTRTIAHFDVFSGIEDGLLGVVLDPDFEENHWVYFYYAVAGDLAINRLSRLELRDERLDMDSEVVLLEIPTQREYCCHAAGYLRFDPDGLLYLATGDNTEATAAYEIGYVPVDERPGHELADDQATAANTMDLRGKILRIHPQPDGSYTIPDGNLFPAGSPKTLPEIYVMGLRNPFRFSVDSKSRHLYVGDIGPDTRVQGRDGSNMSYDEINHITGPGFYGWPYFLGDNEAFPMYDFATGEEGPPKDPSAPLNNSPNNTGIEQLPPAQPAMIWYGKEPSGDFPLVGSGGASAMAGPVYYSDLFPDSNVKLPDYYHGKLFIYEWVRNWVMAVSLDENGGYLGMEPFLESMEFASPMDLQLGPNGELYILEYGTNWFAKNNDAKLIRIAYHEGNRPPVAAIHADQLYGAAPFEVHFSASGSIDFDTGDVLDYRWLIDGHEFTDEELTYTFENNGRYNITLTVSDSEGAEDTSEVQITVGNSPPSVRIHTEDNRSFYWDDSSLNYQVMVDDLEDQPIDSSRAEVSFDFLPRSSDLAVILANSEQALTAEHLRGRDLIGTLNCQACHSMDQSSVGPSYQAISERYADQAGIVEQLATTIMEGGSGNWGDRVMIPHPGLAAEDAHEIVRYILSLNDSNTNNTTLPLQDTLTLTDHIGNDDEGSYLLTARYTDRGANDVEPLTAQAYLALRNPLVQIEDFDEGNVRLSTVATESWTYASGLRHESFVMFRDLDLSHISEIGFRVQPLEVGGSIEVRVDRLDGRVIGIADVPVEDNDWQEVGAEIDVTNDTHDVYFVFINPNAPEQRLFNLDWIQFLKSTP